LAFRFGELQHLHQRVRQFFLCDDGIPMFFYALAGAYQLHAVARYQMMVHHLRYGENAHACCAGGFEQRAAFKLAHGIGVNAVALKPLVNARALHRG
jgi:hypothetical protein